jgi:CheY-like chemotaxis protein
MNYARVLLVDDDADDAELVIECLRRASVAAEIDVVADGVEALEYLSRRGRYAERLTQNPALILLDLKMPKFDGLQVLRHLKSDPALKRLPVVVLTSSAHELDVLAGYDGGANAYVVKPVDFHDLEAVVVGIGRFWLVGNTPPP